MVTNAADVLSINDSALYEGGYKPIGATNLGERMIGTYLLYNEGAEARAAEAVKKLLVDNPFLCATFSMETLKGKLCKKPYLIINGLAVCLSKDGKEERKTRFKDRYFTVGLLKHPVRCSQGHLLEKKLVGFWKDRYPESCPAGDDHGVPLLEVDTDLERDIKVYAQNRKVEEKISDGERGLIDTLRGRVDPVTAFGAAGKVAVKQSRKQVIILVSRPLLRRGGKKMVALTIAKKVPFLGLFLGMGLGGYRLVKGEYGRAAGEVLSGALACVPGWGTVGSVAVDASLMVADLNEARKEVNLDGDYKTLGIDLHKLPHPTKRHVDYAFRTHPTIFYSDQYKQIGGEFQAAIIRAIVNVLAARSHIYRARGWNEEVVAKETASPEEISSQHEGPSSPVESVPEVIPSLPAPTSEEKVLSEEDIAGCYFMLGVDVQKNLDPTKKQVDDGYKQQMEVVMDGSLSGFGEEFEEKLNQVAKVIEQARDNIYTFRKW